MTLISVCAALSSEIGVLLYKPTLPRQVDYFLFLAHLHLSWCSPESEENHLLTWTSVSQPQCCSLSCFQKYNFVSFCPLTLLVAQQLWHYPASSSSVYFLFCPTCNYTLGSKTRSDSISYFLTYFAFKILSIFSPSCVSVAKENLSMKANKPLPSSITWDSLLL